MNDIYVGSLFSEAYLEHHGIKGMHWGVRRFQREDGSLTSAGKKRKLVNEHKNEGEKKRGSLKGAGHRALGKVYDINEKFYRKVGNKTLASMNKAAKTQQLKKAEKADADANAKREKARLNSPDTKKASEKAVKSKEPVKVGEKLKGAVKEGAARVFDKSALGKNYQRAEINKSTKGVIQRGMDNLKAAKGRDTLRGKASELYGAGAAKRYYQNEANRQKALAKSYLSNKNKSTAERNARNAEQQAKYFDSVNKGKTKDTLRGRFNIPYEKANGKTTTRGKNYIAGVGKRALRKGAVEVGKKALGVAITYAAGRAAVSAASKNYNVLEVQTLEDFSRRRK